LVFKIPKHFNTPVNWSIKVFDVKIFAVTKYKDYICILFYYLLPTQLFQYTGIVEG